jgi:sulfotransferase family protein
MVHSFPQGPVQQYVSREPRAVPPDVGHAPVFVLTTARSESAFLRMVLDSHPDLARPPEAGAAFGYGRLARVMGVLDRLYRFGPLSDNLITGTPLHVVLESYAQRPGNARWPGNPLDCIVFAHQLARSWPRSQFICLTRHCSDVIASSLDASRWAMSGAGLDPDADSDAGSAPADVAASIGAFWLASAQAIVAFSESYPGRCHHLRHEDLRTDPEDTVQRLFSFLGVPPPELTPMPGPPADQAPVTAWPLPATDSIDQLLAALGYLEMNEHRTQHSRRRG